jgi:polyisoprenoid-binding protein YceI
VTSETGGSVDVLVRGELTIHGVSREVAVPLKIRIDADSISAIGTTSIEQTAFGIRPISIGGVVKVKDELRLEWQLKAHPFH